jgi:hypothetical protein
MGIDANELICKTENEEDARLRYSHRHPGFEGELLFDLTFSFLGQSVTRKAKLVYEHTPEWPYYDLQKNAEYEGWSGTSYHLQLAAQPEEYDHDDKLKDVPPEWFKLEDLIRDGVLPNEVWDSVLDAVDEKCKVEDAERRRAATQRATPGPRSRRRH